MGLLLHEVVVGLVDVVLWERGVRRFHRAQTGFCGEVLCP